MEERGIGTGIAIGFAAGAVVGLAVAFLYAPMPGREVRELCREHADDVTGRVRETFADREKLYIKSWKQQKEQGQLDRYQK